MIKTNTDAHDFQVTSTGQITAAPLILAKAAKTKPTTEYEESQEFQESPESPRPNVATERDIKLMQAQRVAAIIDGGEHE